ASLFQIVSMLSKGFLSIIFLAVLIATPISWFLMSKWLDGYAYKIDIQIWIFIYAAICLILIAALTISYQSLKAAFLNPVIALKEK
ncbi:MAG: ABC transporter permease, partial [Bacteroidota bacterium]